MSVRKRSKGSKPNYQRGAFGEYSGYRYGESAKRHVHIPGKDGEPKPINKDSNDRIVSEITEVLRGWRHSAFEREGACRAGVRSALCLSGNDWEASDNTAAEIVSTGLQRIGAKRPSWEEGQPEYLDAFSRCACCHGPLDEEDLLSNRRRRFCSETCARVMIERFVVENRSKELLLYEEAMRTLRITKIDHKLCIECGRPFQSDAINQKYCGHSCAARRRVRQLNEYGLQRECDWCGVVFKAHNHKGKFCSGACSQASQSTRRGKMPVRLVPHVFDHYFIKAA